MTPERWQQVERLYHAALEREVNQRPAFLREACPGDDALRREVESLLAQEDGASLLEKPALEVAAKALGGDGGPSLLGRQIGGYQVISLLGAGGMGEVYEARDSKLGRKVAIKILPAGFANDAERLARFQREARMLAALNHPHIATIYGLEQSSGVHYLVMELVPGENLAQRISKGALPVEEALKVAGQIAEALEAAHERGVIHRDLKPANVKVTPEGKVKVLDFGLAKAFASDGTLDPSQSLTLTGMVSEEGRILGTPAYMSPEQARGKPVDKRTDIWAFGCILFEMLSGFPTFKGDTISDTIAAILEREPAWDLLPDATPHSVHRLLRRCLEKDSKRRLRDIGDARIDLDEALAAPASAAPVAEPFKTQLRWMWGVAVSLVALGLGLGWTMAHLRQPAAETQTLELAVTSPDGTEFSPIRGSAISPDGRLLAFVTTSPSGVKLWIRPLNSLVARELPGTDDATLPFWSPDSRSLGFFAAGKLKRVEVAGGSPTVVCDVSLGRGGTWNEQGIILFNAVNDGPLLQVPAAGGTPVPVTTVDTAQHENSHRWPQFLPGGRRFLYFNRSGISGPETSGVYLGSLDRPQEKVRLLSSQTEALYAPDRDKQSGHLFWVRDGALMAQRFDPEKAQLTDETVTVAEGVAFFTSGNGLIDISVSDDGRLFYGAAQIARYQLTWYGRDGKSLGGLGQPDAYSELRIAPDGKRVGLRRGGDIWQMEFARGIATLVTFKAASSGGPIWSPDSQRVVYNQYAPPNLFSHSASGTGTDERLVESSDGMGPEDWSPDGRFVLYSANSNDISSKTQSDLWLLPMTGDRKPEPFLTTPFREGHGQFSPDGKWIAYVSDESGRNEVYVQSFPASSFKRQVSSKGGDWMRWRRDGKELFYVAPDRKVMSVAVRAAPLSLEFGAPSALFAIPAVSPNGLYTYDVMPDGGRFLALAPTAEAESTPMTVVLNWQADLPGAK